jgi:subtilisin family serine protease
VNWNVTMISGKFLGRNGGTTANAIKAVRYFTDLKVRHGLNIVATNNSWGGGGFSQALLDAITDGAKQNILFIAAAGNGGPDGVGDNNDSVASYPSNYNTTAGAGWDAVIAVAAITSTGARASFSNYGATKVDIGAPGSGVISTTAPNNYSSYSGTSMATPHVTGAAALYASLHPGVTGIVIKDAILNSAIPTASMSGRCVTNGRLNVGGF